MRTRERAEEVIREQRARTVGTRLRQYRVAKGVRQADVADAAGVSQSTLSRLERGHTPHVTLDVLRRVSTVLGISFEFVVS